MLENGTVVRFVATDLNTGSLTINGKLVISTGKTLQAGDLGTLVFDPKTGNVTVRTKNEEDQN